MDCPHRTQSDTAERYVAGTLPEAEQEAFEDHFFACEACLADVQAIEAARVVLVREAPAPFEARTVSRWRLPVWAGLAAAAVLVLALVTRQGLLPEPLEPTPPPGQARPPASPAPPGGSSTAPGAGAPEPAGATPVPAAPSREALLEQLAAVVAPRYVAVATRGTADRRDRFDRAMADYAAGRHAQAADALRALAAERPAADVDFFLGISELMIGRAAAARDRLERVVSGQVQPYADEAHFYLAKASIRLGDVARARRELALAIEREAGPEGEAARLLKRLPAR
jgi:hypothetical protein